MQNGLLGVMTYPPITLCCQAIAPHWKKPDEINAGCWLLQFHGTPHCHPECLSPDWDICKLSSPINSCLVWCCRCPPDSDSEMLWCTISTSSSVRLLKVRTAAKKIKNKIKSSDSGWRLTEQKPFQTTHKHSHSYVHTLPHFIPSVVTHFPWLLIWHAAIFELHQWKQIPLPVFGMKWHSSMVRLKVVMSCVATEVSMAL